MDGNIIGRDACWYPDGVADGGDTFVELQAVRVIP